MKKIILIIFLITWHWSYSQDSIVYNNKGFHIACKVQNIDNKHSSVILYVKNLSDEDRYISITKNNLNIISEKIAFLDIGNSWNTDPLMSPNMLFYFVRLKKDEIYETMQTIYNDKAEILSVKLEYFSSLKKIKKKLKIIDSDKAIYALKCKYYVDSAYTKGEILQVSQKMEL